MTSGRVVAALGVIGALLTSACGGAGAPAPTFEDPGVAHVHGLGVDPGDGTLYAATHTGIFTLPAKGKATRIADRYQDTMGFTVVGPRHFLGSGHPDQRDTQLHVEGTRPLLGLIESTDAGVTWHKQSLFGEADFHALSAAHGRVYGYEATGSRFLVTTDNKTWETRNAGIALGGFAVSPTDPEAIVATSEAGLVASSDGGRTFAPVADAPPFITVSWHAARTLWGGNRRRNRPERTRADRPVDEDGAGSRRTRSVPRHRRRALRRRDGARRTHQHLPVDGRRRHLGTPLPRSDMTDADDRVDAAAAEGQR
jgi:hypothetical protein